jgi:hypothetical protein
MAEGRRGGANSYRVISGGGNDPLVLAGTADPSSGGGVAAPEGSIYLLNSTGAGKNYFKAGAANTAWTEVPSLGTGPLSGVESNLWAPPSSPSSEDDEFTSDTLSTGWTTQGDTFDDTTPPAIGANFNSGNLRYSFSQRNSWLRMQAVADSTYNYIFKRFSGFESALPDGTYWTRLSQQVWSSDSSLYPGDCALALIMGYSATGASINTSVDGIEFSSNAITSVNGIYTSVVHRVAGTPTSQDLNDLSGYIPHAYLAIIKDGDYFLIYAKPEEGAWVFVDATSHGAGANNLNAVGFFIRNTYYQAGGVKGNGIVEVDFFRYRSDGQLP